MLTLKCLVFVFVLEVVNRKAEAVADSGSNFKEARSFTLQSNLQLSSRMPISLWE